MSRDTRKSNQVILARVGLVLSFFVFMLAAVVAFSSGVSSIVVLVLSVCAGLLLWAAIFAGSKVALILGRLFPLG